MMRGIVLLVIVVGACFLGHRFAEHQEGKDAFETLYMHLMPAVLVEDNHAHGSPALLEVPLPGFLGVFDYRDGAEHDGGEHEGGPRTALFNLQIFQVAAVLLVLAAFAGVARYVRTGKGDPWSRVFAGFAMWIRDEMVYPVMGKDLGRKFLPYFLSVFFFILFMNLFGLIPFGATATASIFVTGALALTTFAGMLGCGMIAQGPMAFWVNLVPIPFKLGPNLVLWLLLLVVELIGILVKPFALMVRLFANMTGGHMVVLSFMGLIFFAAGQWGSGGGWGASPLGAGFAIFIMVIEAFVAMVQAYVFTQLSIIFVNASVHPGH